MANKFIVLFEPGKVPEIKVNADPQQFDPRYMLVNPVLPRGIPPHRWAKVGNSIHVLPEDPLYEQLPKIALMPSRPRLEKKHYVLMAVASAVAATLLHILTKG